MRRQEYRTDAAAWADEIDSRGMIDNVAAPTFLGLTPVIDTERLGEWRQCFLAARNTNKVRIKCTRIAFQDVGSITVRVYRYHHHSRRNEPALQKRALELLEQEQRCRTDVRARSIAKEEQRPVSGQRAIVKGVPLALQRKGRQ